MYAITGITGKVGGELARALLSVGQPVRGIVRDAAKGASWAAQGCEVALASMEDAAQLTAAFAGADSVFILPPPEFDPEPGYPEAIKVIDAVVTALIAVRPKKVVCLSTIGADAPHDNLLSQRTMMEQSLGAALGRTGVPVTFLRPGWFMENAQWDVPSARDAGVVHSFLRPADKAFPMVAASDVGRTAAGLIQEKWTGTRVVELEGPARVSPNDLAQAFATVLGRRVRVEVVPRATWEDLFRSQGMKHPAPRTRMLEGFNEGWIAFRDGGRFAVRGETQLIDVITSLVAASNVTDAA
jgi:uncharacterized protein YbjT (DUF2867 family)